MTDITLRIQKIGGSMGPGDVLRVRVSDPKAERLNATFSVQEYDVELQPKSGPGFESDLRRHIEDYANVEPFEESQANRIQQAIDRYSESLFTQLNLPTVIDGLFDKVKKKEQGLPKFTIELHVLEGSEDEMSLIHWESLECRRFVSSRPEVSIRVYRVLSFTDSSLALVKPKTFPKGGTGMLNILVVVARYYNWKDEKDIDYREVTVPLTNVAEQFPSDLIRVDVVSEGSWAAVQKALADRPVGHYQIVHFDVHGKIRHSKGQLMFEKHPSKVDAATVGNSLVDRGVQGAILTVCQSAEKPCQSSSSLAMALVRCGLNFVIGMAYKVHKHAVFWFVQGLYSALLIKNTTLSEAVALGRQQMEQHPTRKGRFDLDVNVQDWLNPVLYTWDCEPWHFIESMTLNGDTKAVPPPVPDWPHEFEGRDADIHNIEMSFSSCNIARIEGFRGAGKSTLMRHLAEWWRRSNFGEDIFLIDFGFTDSFTPQTARIYPRGIFHQISALITNQEATPHSRPRIYDIRPFPSHSPVAHDLQAMSGLASTGREDLHLADYINESEDQEADAAVLSHLRHVFRQKRCVILVNNLHNVTSLVHGGGFDFCLWTEEMKYWLKMLEWQENSIGVILFSSMLVEEWIDKLGAQAVSLEGFDLYHATRYAARVINLTPYTTDAKNRMYLEKILGYYKYQPLAIKVVLPQLAASGLSPPEYFDKTLCSGIELSLQQEAEQGALLMDFITGIQAMETWLPGLDSVQSYCPLTYLISLLEGNGPYKAEEDPGRVLCSCIETLQDFAMVRYVPGIGETSPVVNPNKISSTAGLELHPLLPAFIRTASRYVGSKRRHGDDGLDFIFAYLVYYLAQRSYSWRLNGTPGDKVDNQAVIDIQQNWFSILSSLQYCVSRPYGWNKALEHAFDTLMMWAISYVANRLTDEKPSLARISRHAVNRVARAFAGPDSSVTMHWWSHLRFVEEAEQGDLRGRLGKILHVHKWMPFPPQLMESMVVHYLFLRTEAWYKFDSVVWQYNEALLGLLVKWEKHLEHHSSKSGVLPHDARYAALKQEALIAAAEIANQTSQHYAEGLQALAKVDLSSADLPDSMRDNLAVRFRDIKAELMGFVMDAQKYEGDVETMVTVHEAERKDKDKCKLPDHRTARAIMVRKAYEKALDSKTVEDTKHAKTLIYEDMAAIRDPTDPYFLILHRFMFDVSISPTQLPLIAISGNVTRISTNRFVLGKLFMLDQSWESALQQLRRIQTFISESNPERQQSIIDSKGRNSYLVDLHRDFARCYEKLGKMGEARKHYDTADALREQRERNWTRQDFENEGMANLIYAMNYAVQSSGLEAYPGWRSPAWVREEIENKKN
ncbi:uncharacterized protein FFB20_12472 [Fusarium fujikuroi]|nr:Uncharacterized protein Y057_10531 [Fusarium fujikuroi]SCN82188.1 uncharacterized protein FFC1_03797 [Fusarium fujikuroi]SCO06120.1 uncharacterized protein FFB20_12472 [Fusarium fujikuroi]SCO18789.1 uncharacterized protein FFE2_14187 [Fusarium fujikuroi]SCV59329.1 uncharacterized protein FFFS_13898 [Fusarium fujikuroi]